MSFILESKNGISPNLAESQFVITCPYHPNHKVEARKFARHILKCKKKQSQAILSRFSICRFNSLHIIPSLEIEAHEVSCPNKKPMENLEKKLLVDEMLEEEESISDSICQVNKAKEKKHKAKMKDKRRKENKKSGEVEKVEMDQPQKRSKYYIPVKFDDSIDEIESKDTTHSILPEQNSALQKFSSEKIDSHFTQEEKSEENSSLGSTHLNKAFDLKDKSFSMCKFKDESEKNEVCFNLSEELRELTESLRKEETAKTEILKPMNKGIKNIEEEKSSRIGTINCGITKMEGKKEQNEQFQVKNSFAKGLSPPSTNEEEDKSSEIAESKRSSNKETNQRRHVNLDWKKKTETVFCEKNFRQVENNFECEKQIPEIDLRNCEFCSEALCNPHVRAWTNKKLMKYLKAYRKLDEEHTQLQEFISTMKLHFMKEKPTSNNIKNNAKIYKSDQSDSSEQSDQSRYEMDVMEEKAEKKGKESAKVGNFPLNGNEKKSMLKSNISPFIPKIEIIISDEENNSQDEILQSQTQKENPDENNCAVKVLSPKFDKLRKLMNSKIMSIGSYENETLETLEFSETSEDIIILD